MLNNLFSLFHTRPAQSRYRPTGVGEEHFNLLASLQMAIRTESMDAEKSTAADMLHGANSVNLRKQVCACFFSFFFLLLPPSGNLGCGVVLVVLLTDPMFRAGYVSHSP